MIKGLFAASTINICFDKKKRLKAEKTCEVFMFCIFVKLSSLIFDNCLFLFTKTEVTNKKIALIFDV